jgi:CHAD domain-containing protein
MRRPGLPGSSNSRSKPPAGCDAQMMLCDVERRLGRFPEATGFKKELLRREKRLGRQLERKLRRTRLKPLKNRMDALRKELRAAVKPAEGRHQAWVRLLKGMDRAFVNVVAQRRRIAPAQPQTIHRTRIAFKKFRYMVEQLRPLLSRLPGGLPGQLRGHQRLMGGIQDCETLLAALDRFMRGDESEARRLRKFRAAVKRDHALLMTRYLRRADELFSFWQPSAKLR